MNIQLQVTGMFPLGETVKPEVLHKHLAELPEGAEWHLKVVRDYSQSDGCVPIIVVGLCYTVTKTREQVLEEYERLINTRKGGQNAD